VKEGGSSASQLAGQKSGMVYALDPDHSREIVWEVRLGKGGVNGGVQWRTTSDGKNLYAATSDVVRCGATG
jgi:polyvinyl alcohol dehydrogenase (cytochrome)